MRELAIAGVKKEVLDHLFRPILTERRYSCSNWKSTLLEIGRKASGLEIEALEGAAKTILASQKMTVKWARLLEAVEIAIKIGAGVVTKPEDGERWQCWLDALEHSDPRAAQLARRLGVHQSRTKWPPTRSIESSGLPRV